ncbi:hypothetical protein NA56DRAFT_743553 [Hyaloscypha hepaticicola]|uniref:Uncharacterized protein n=1 Tax=Hyaloscypha hepaticicola TaxID=2082293 RepID=A0A2J6QLU6_9HELO|nr:hypothetical protein NA56DRAFT_743553 [Hyaloscypha hepaticicola]
MSCCAADDLKVAKRALSTSSRGAISSFLMACLAAADEPVLSNDDLLMIGAGGVTISQIEARSELLTGGVVLMLGSSLRGKAGRFDEPQRLLKRVGSSRDPKKTFSSENALQSEVGCEIEARILLRCCRPPTICKRQYSALQLPPKIFDHYSNARIEPGPEAKGLPLPIHPCPNQGAWRKADFQRVDRQGTMQSATGGLVKTQLPPNEHGLLSPALGPRGSEARICLTLTVSHRVVCNQECPKYSASPKTGKNVIGVACWKGGFPN